MADNNLNVMLELERRGALPPEKVAILNELRARGVVPGGPPQQANMPDGGSWTMPMPGMYQPGGDPNAVVNRQNMQAVLPGVARAPQAFLEGAGGIMDDLATGLYNWQQKHHLGEPDNYKPLPPGPDRFHQAVDEMRAADDAKYPGSVAVSDVAAGMLPIGRFANPKAVTTLIDAVTKGIGEGVMASQIPYQQASDRPKSAAIGATAGLVLPLATKTKDAVFNMMAKRVIDRTDTQTKQLVANAMNAFVDPVTGNPLKGMDDYTAAQASGDPRLIGMTAQAADTGARDYLRGQLDQRVKNINAVADSLGGPQTIANDEGRAKAFYTVVDQHDQALREARNTSYNTDMTKLQASPEGAAMRVPIRGFMDQMDQTTKEMGDIVEIAKKGGASPKMIETLEALQKAPKAVRTAQVNLPTFRDLTIQLNEGRNFGSAIVADPEVARWNKVRGQLAGALNQSVDSMPANAPGAATFRDITQKYAQASDGIRRMEDDVVVKLFGDKGVIADPDSAFNKFLAASPSAQRMGVDILGQRNPELLGYLRKRYLNNIVTDATGGATPAMQSTLDPSSLLKGLTNDKIMKSPLFTPDQKKWMVSAGDDLRVILNSLPDTTRVGTAVTLADIAPNIYSMNGTFLARQAARIVTAVGLEDLLFTPEGRKTLNTVRNLSMASDKAKQQAAAYLGAAMARTQTDQQQGTQQ